ncbi:MAG: transglycosylase SLT domain-containing protein [Rhodopila sp.]
MTALSWAMILQLASAPACSAPGMVPQFWPAVVRKESSYNPYALHDDTASRSYYPDTAAAAESIARQLMAQGHSVGVGLSQLTAQSEPQFERKFGLTLHDALEPCANMRVGARFFVSAALSIYNSGHPTAALNYAASITGSIRPGVDPAPHHAPVDPPASSIFVRPGAGSALITTTNSQQ